MTKKCTTSADKLSCNPFSAILWYGIKKCNALCHMNHSCWVWHRALMKTQRGSGMELIYTSYTYVASLSFTVVLRSCYFVCISKLSEQISQWM